MSPKLQGQVGIVEPPHVLEGKYCFTIWLDNEIIVTHGPFDTEELALLHMKDMIRFTGDALFCAEERLLH